jgi:hypothetical protein
VVTTRLYKNSVYVNYTRGKRVLLLFAVDTNTTTQHKIDFLNTLGTAALYKAESGYTYTSERLRASYLAIRSTEK